MIFKIQEKISSIQQTTNNNCNYLEITTLRGHTRLYERDGILKFFLCRENFLLMLHIFL